MSATIITGIISAAAAILVCLINNHYVRIESDKKHEANIILISYRLEQLEKKVDVHNNLIERTFKLEQDNEVMQEKMKVANHRIDDLERSKGA